MELYRLRSWNEPEYGKSYNETEQYFLSQNRQDVIKLLRKRDIDLNSDGSCEIYDSYNRASTVYVLEQVAVEIALAIS